MTVINLFIFVVRFITKQSDGKKNLYMITCCITTVCAAASKSSKQRGNCFCLGTLSILSFFTM